MSKNEPNKNDRKTYYGIGKDIVNEGIFERFPELIPYVGGNYYSDNHKRLIFIGESNYFPVEFDLLVKKIEQHGNKTLLPLSPEERQSLRDFIEAFPDENKWYKEYIGKPIPKSIESFVGNAIYYKTFNDNVFCLIKHLLKDETEVSGLEQVAFYNYFLRPAVDNGRTKGFKPKPLDCGVAGTALCGIIECLQPQIIVFVSKKAFREFKKYLDYKDCKYIDSSKFNIRYNDTEIHAINHPNAWRYTRKDNPNHPKILLENILKDNWLNK